MALEKCGLCDAWRNAGIEMNSHIGAHTMYDPLCRKIHKPVVEQTIDELARKLIEIPKGELDKKIANG